VKTGSKTRANSALKRGVATIEVVARHAGVAPMTVSRVLNGATNVRESTRVKVKASIAALNYVPNQAAQRLAGSEQIRIGVLYSNPSAAYLSEFLVGLLDQASRSHVQLVVEKCEAGSSEDDQAHELINNGIDGLILPPPLCDTKSLLQLVQSTGTPAVQVATGSPAAGLSAVGIDDQKAAAEMTRHVLALGHQRVGFIIGNPNQTASARRLAGYRAALADAGLPADPALIEQGTFNYRSGLDAAELLLSLEQRPTAIFASNDDMAAATVAVAHRMGIDVPSDLTVVGFDDTAIATTIWPELTTIRQPIAEMARMALEMMVRRIRAKRSGETEPIDHHVMDFTLMRRQSDAAPRVRPPVRIAPVVAERGRR
jgi:LacI family transcriptional regulator